MTYKPSSSGAIANVIKRLLYTNHINAYVFGKRADLTRDYVSKLVNGKIAEPKAEKFCKIAQGLGITKQELQKLIEAEFSRLSSQAEPKNEDIEIGDQVVANARCGSELAPNFVVRKEAIAHLDTPKQVEAAIISSPETTPITTEPDSKLEVAAFNPNFVGREEAIADLNTLVSQGEKAILIWAPGGVGKTTLAQQFLKAQGFELVLEFPIAKETQNIAPVEKLIEERLLQLGDNPVPDFLVSLDRLKRQLQMRRVGVLIDNLEPALDKQGKFIEPHRRYVELLRVLADSTVQSVTLITSREPLIESINVRNYPLPILDKQAWKVFFSSRNINIDNDTVLEEIHKAYGGNALAMKVLCDPIKRDGGMAAYWREHKVEADILVELAVKNLIKEQFNRLEEIYPEAYRLLCRLGCYRYQDVPTVPTKGLLCLSWEVSEVQGREIIKALRNRSLVECKNGEYWLHPVIRAEAIARLRQSEDWEEANRKAAEFWTESVTTVETVEDARRAFEAYYHYLEINDFERAAEVIVNPRDNKWETTEHLGRSFYRLGLLQPMTVAITRIVSYLKPGYPLSRLYNILGDIYWLIGYIYKSIECHENSRKIAIKFNIISLQISSLYNIGLCKTELWHIEEAARIFEEVASMAENTDYRRYAVHSWYCLAYLNSILGFKEKALSMAEKACREDSTKDWTTWAVAYKPLFLGLTYKNLKYFNESFEMYEKAIAYAEESYYTQVKAKALTGLAELYREQGDFEKAFSHHSESIEILDKIGAKCDLAEAYYQLALTYQKMGNAKNSQENFDKAIALFTDMDAPRQVERVERSIGGK